MTREPGRIKPPATVFGGAAALLPAQMAFAAVVFACVLIAVAGPRGGLAFRTHTLQRVFASALASQKLVEADADWAAFDESVFGRSVYGANGTNGIPLTPAQIASARGELASALTGVPLPLAARSRDWSSLSTPLDQAAGAARTAYAARPPRMEISYRDTLSLHSRLIQGRLPATARTGPGPGTGVTTALQVAVTEATAARFGLHTGSRLAVSGVTLVITGIIRPADPGSGFWTVDSIAAAPKLLRSVPFGDPVYWMGGAFVGPGEISALQTAFGSQRLSLRWAFPLALGGIDADHARFLSDRLSRVTSESVPANQVANGTHVPLGTVTLTNGLLFPLAGFLGAQAAVQTVLALLFTGLAVLGATALLIGVRLLAERRRGELALMRARGASLRQLAALAARDAAVVAVPAAAVGAALAVAVTPGGDTRLAWWLAGATLLVPLAGLPVVVALQHRGAGTADTGAAKRAAAQRTQARKTRAGGGPARRWIIEGALVAAAAGGLVIGRRHGVSGANLYTSAAPVFVAIPAALLVLRLYPVVLRGVLRLISGRAGAGGFVGVATAARSPLAAILPVFALILALTMGAFGGMMRGAVARGEAAAAWRTTGADARIDLSDAVVAQVDAARRAVAAAPGVHRVAEAVVTTGSLNDGTELSVAAVDPAAYARLVADTPLPGLRPAKLARRPGPVPVIASPSAVTAITMAGGDLQLPTGDVTIRIAGTAGAAAALPGADGFVVLPLWALHGGATPNLMLVTGRTLDEGKLAAALNRSVGNAATVTFRSGVLAELARAPLQHGAYVMFAVGIAEAAGLSAAVLLLSLALGARPRDLTLARLATMGLDLRQRRLLVFAETVPATLAAAAGGVACAWLLAPLIGPALDLSVFTGSPAPVSIRADLVAVGVPAAGLVALGLLIMTGEVAIAGGRNLGRMLRSDG
jgi:putative ABC transport system permease protein